MTEGEGEVEGGRGQHCDEAAERPKGASTPSTTHTLSLLNGAKHTSDAYILLYLTPPPLSPLPPLLCLLLLPHTPLPLLFEQALESSLTCMACLSIMINPVTLVPCGHNYCQSCASTAAGCGECGPGTAVRYALCPPEEPCKIAP